MHQSLSDEFLLPANSGIPHILPVSYTHLDVYKRQRYDLLLHQSKDEAINRSTAEYTRELIVNHVSGRLKVAPEHRCV